MAENKQHTGELIVAPIPGNRRGMIWEQEKDFVAQLREGGEIHETSLGEYKGVLYPGSKQTIRPEYRVKRGKFVIIDKDGNEWDNDKVVEEMLNKVKLRYGSNHPQAGQVIETCDITDPDDPFLCHSFWEKDMEAGLLHKQNEAFVGPITDYIRGNSDVSVGASEDAVAGHKRFRIVDEKLEGERKEAEVSNSMEAFEYFRAMKDSRQRMLEVLTLLNEVVTEDMSIGRMQALLMDKYVKDGTTKENGMRRQDLFMKFARMDVTELTIRRIIRKAIRRGIIGDESGSYTWRGTRIGINSDDLYAYFSEGDNKKQFDLLKEAVKNEQ